MKPQGAIVPLHHSLIRMTAAPSWNIYLSYPVVLAELDQSLTRAYSELP